MGAEPANLGKPPAPKRKGSLALWALGIFLGFFIYASIRPVMRLRNDPPAEFFEIGADWRPAQRVAEERLARAYWQRAVHSVQWKHSFGTPLPDTAPPEFTIQEKGSQPGTGEASAVVRTRYWQKVRKVWPLPQTWDKSHEWSTAWVGEALLNFQQAARRLVDDILRNFKY